MASNPKIRSMTLFRKDRFPLMLAAVLVFVAGAAARADEFTFTIHHFLSPRAITQTKLLEPWAERVTQQSGGRLRFEIFPSMTLGGRPASLYQQVRDGTADLVWTLPGYTPGVFPRLEVFELAGVHGGSAYATTMAIQDLLPDVAPDLKDVKPILVHVHAGNALHLVDRKVQSPADVASLKIRSPSRTGVWMIESWNAEPVGMPVPDLPQALSKRTIDGALIPFEVAIPLKVADLTSVSVELQGKRRFGTSTFLFAMNKARYDALPPELKQVIDDNSGRAIAGGIADAWDAIEPVGKDLARDRGNQVYELSPEASTAFDDLHQGLADRWVNEVDELGIDGKTLLAKAKSAIARHELSRDAARGSE